VKKEKGNVLSSQRKGGCKISSKLVRKNKMGDMHFGGAPNELTGERGIMADRQTRLKRVRIGQGTVEKEKESKP